MITTKIQLGDLLGSLHYMGQCYVCGRQFMSTHDTVFVVSNGNSHINTCSGICAREYRESEAERLGPDGCESACFGDVGCL